MSAFQHSRQTFRRSTLPLSEWVMTRGLSLADIALRSGRPIQRFNRHETSTPTSNGSMGVADPNSSPVWDFLTNPVTAGLIGTALGAIGTFMTNITNRHTNLQGQINEAFSHLIEGYERRISDLENHIEELKDHVIDLKTVIQVNGLQVPDVRTPRNK